MGLDQNPAPGFELYSVVWTPNVALWCQLIFLDLSMINFL